MSVKLHFHGAAGTVTGSCYRIVHPGGQFLVDCGMFQGNKTVRDLNYKPTPFDPARIDYLLLTHAHIDHAGLIPKLYGEGFKGALFATEQTNALIEFMLEDGAGIQESEAERENRKRERRGEKPIEPLYTMVEAGRALEHRNEVKYEEWFAPGPGVRARYWNAGHILGSASIEVEVNDAGGEVIRMLFSGDIGPDEKVFYRNPDAPAGFDYILTETTYGGREREDKTLQERREVLKSEVNAAMERGGNLVVPTFAVERTQELLHDIGTLIRSGEIDPQLVFLDSPLASKVTSIYKRYAGLFEDVELGAKELFSDDRFRITQSVKDSQGINAIRGGAIILSASGMCEAGRIKHHLRANLIRGNATVMFVGYQAPGTLGQIIQSGARDVRIHGHQVPVRATIRSIPGYSAHADHSELMAWNRERLPAHGAIFLVHGEDEGRAALRAGLLKEGLASDQIISPMLDDAFELHPSGIGAVDRPTERRIDPVQFTRDWHNEYSDFIVKLSQQLNEAQTDRDRLRLMKTLQSALEEAEEDA